jgi:hypothetical protein
MSVRAVQYIIKKLEESGELKVTRIKRRDGEHWEGRNEYIIPGVIKDEFYKARARIAPDPTDAPTDAMTHAPTGATELPPNSKVFKESKQIQEQNLESEKSSEKAEIVPSKLEPYFRAFRNRWRSATGVGCPKGKMEPEFVEKYAAACAAYGELEVLSMVDEYGVQNAEWIQKFRASPKKFFEDVDEMAEARKITAQRIENSKPIDAWERIRLKNEAEDRERGRK